MARTSKPPALARSARLTLAGAALAAAGCSLFSFLPDRRSPTEKAQALDKRCRDYQDADVAPLLSSKTVEGVEPAYTYVQTGNDRRPNLRGARIHIRPLPGLSAEAMGRTLECHQAGIVLGHQTPAGDDPYTLPGRWLKFDVSSEPDGFVVLASVESIEDAREELERAKRFFAANQGP